MVKNIAFFSIYLHDNYSGDVTQSSWPALFDSYLLHLGLADKKIEAATATATATATTAADDNNSNDTKSKFNVFSCY